MVYAWFFGCLMLTVFYTCLMLYYRQKWLSIPETIAPGVTPATKVSIIIPARNEAENIGNLLQDIHQQDYPKELMEVIVIDDHSEDTTGEIATGYDVQLYKLQDLLPQSEVTGVYKKRAIEQAVKKASGKLIITTDADCRVGPQWVKSLVSCFERSGSKLVAAPVLLEQDNTLFENFQVLDFCGMQAITGASLQSKLYNMANGANLAYEKDAFIQVGGYKGIDTKASGDDMLLVFKIAQHYDGAVKFLKSKEAIVKTAVTHSFSDFLQQRFRWTSKSGSYQDKRMTIILGLVYLFVLSIFVNFFYALATSLTIIWIIFSVQLIFKSIVDYYFLRSAVTFFGRQDVMRTFITSQALHCWYIVFVGTLGNVLPYTWKGRKLK